MGRAISAVDGAPGYHDHERRRPHVSPPPIRKRSPEAVPQGTEEALLFQLDGLYKFWSFYTRSDEDRNQMEAKRTEMVSLVAWGVFRDGVDLDSIWPEIKERLHFGEQSHGHQIAEDDFRQEILAQIGRLQADPAPFHTEDRREETQPVLRIDTAEGSITERRAIIAKIFRYEVLENTTDRLVLGKAGYIFSIQYSPKAVIESISVQDAHTDTAIEPPYTGAVQMLEVHIREHLQ